MAGVGDEAALADQAGFEAGKHVVERLPQPEDLVVGPWERELASGRVGRDLRRPPTHHLDRAEQSACKQVAGNRREHERDRPADEQRRQKPLQGLVPLLERGPDDNRLPTLGLGDEQAVGTVSQLGYVSVDEASTSSRWDEGRAEALWRGGDHRSVLADELPDALILFHERSASQVAPGDRSGLSPQSGVHLLVERAPDLEEEEGA